MTKIRTQTHQKREERRRSMHSAEERQTIGVLAQQLLVLDFRPLAPSC